MELESPRAAARRRRRSTAAIKQSLRGLRSELSGLNHQVSRHLDLRDSDLDCYDLISRLGPLSPSAIARSAGLHPATVTGVVDRLERAGWVARERDSATPDRRAVSIRALRDRNSELFHLLSGMNSAMDDVCARYTESELELIADFLARTSTAGRDATKMLADS